MTEESLTAAQWKDRALHAEKRLEIRETELKCRHLIQWFSNEMLGGLRLNADHGEILDPVSMEALLSRLEGCVEELREAVEGARSKDVVRQSADLANLVARIADLSAMND